MSYIIVGLGNPDAEFEGTRHNTGRVLVKAFEEANEFGDWKEDNRIKSLLVSGKVGKEKVELVLPNTFMNNSGKAVGKLISSKKAAERLVVIHDDLDIPLGRFKISFNKSSGGHHGVESVVKAIGTEAFIRIRVGISPANSKGVVKKPKGEEAVGKFILGKFKSTEHLIFKKVSKKVVEAIAMIVEEGREKAMGIYNSQ
jgi:peptidyl-tRNA hydrolase, PTH1 family